MTSISFIKRSLGRSWGSFCCCWSFSDFRMDSETLRLSGLLPQNKKIYQRKSGKGISSFNVLDVLMVSAFLAFRDWENMALFLSASGLSGLSLIVPSLPNTSWEGVLGMFLGSKYLLTFGVWKPREWLPKRLIVSFQVPLVHQLLKGAGFDSEDYRFTISWLHSQISPSVLSW